MKTPKKAAEGPLGIRNGSIMVGGCWSEIMDPFSESHFSARKGNRLLLRWLNTKSGKRWMEENGVMSSRRNP
jgi:hypothetical protein